MSGKNGKPKTVQRAVQVKLSPEEKEKIATEQADCELGIKGLEAERAPITEKINAERKRRHALATSYKSGTREVLMECEVVEDFTHNVFRYLRPDTKEEVGTAPMSAADRETDLDFENGHGDDDGEEKPRTRAGERHVGEEKAQPKDSARRASKAPKLRSIKGGRKTKDKHPRA